VPVVSAGIYYSFYKIAFGNWVPTPIFFKTVSLRMLGMTEKPAVVADLLLYFMEGSHALALTCVLFFLVSYFQRKQYRAFFTEDRRVLSLGLYTLATLPLLLFYSITFRTLHDFTLGTYPRYWVAFELSLQLLVLAMLARVDLTWGSQSTEAAGIAPAWRQQGALIAFLCLSVGFATGRPLLQFTLTTPGRSDSLFAGAFTERFLPPDLTVSTTELDTFGLLIERPVIDLWGYTTPAIAFSHVCSGDRIRSNGEYFLKAKPDVFWPYWFTKGFEDEAGMGKFENVEESFATFHHTSKRGNHLGDMSQVLAEYDVVMIQTASNQLAYLVRKEKNEGLIASLLKSGFSMSRQRPLDMPRFHRLYDRQEAVTYPCP
jgi:hypothetical protein